MERYGSGVDSPAATMDPRQLTKSTEARGSRTPSFLQELRKVLDEIQSQASEVAGRLRNNADALLGPEPEPGNRNGAEVKQPPPMALVHQLGEVAQAISSTLREARHQLDRLDAL